MRILIAHEAAAGGGGVESYLASVIPGLQARGHQVAFLHHMTRAAVGPTRLQFDRVANFCIEDDGFRPSLERIAAWKPDVCFSHNMGPLAVDEALLAKWPVVKMMHGYFGTCISSHKAHAFPSIVPCTRTFGAPCLALYGPRRCGPLRPLKALRNFQWNVRQHGALDRYRAIVVASGYMRSEYLRHGVLQERVITAPLFPTTELPATPRPMPADPTVLFAGRMTDLKGPRILVEAAAIASSVLRRPIRLVMAGDGPERLPLIDLARRLRVRATFPGWVTGADRTALLRGATLIAVPSMWPEPFGLIGLEAAVHGVPAVAFDTGGISEWLHNGISGRLVPERGDADALGRALASVLDNADLLRIFQVGAVAIAARMNIQAHLQILEGAFAAATRPTPAGATTA